MKQWIDMFNKKGKIYKWRHTQTAKRIISLTFHSFKNEFTVQKFIRGKKLHWKNCAVKTVDEMSERKFIQNEAAATVLISGEGLLQQKWNCMNSKFKVNIPEHSYGNMTGMCAFLEPMLNAISTIINICLQKKYFCKIESLEKWEKRK